MTFSDPNHSRSHIIVPICAFWFFVHVSGMIEAKAVKFFTQVGHIKISFG